MRILQVGKFYPPVHGGMETVLRHMCEGLLDRGHAVTAVVAGVGSEDRVSALRDGGSESSGRLVQAGTLAWLDAQPLAPSLPHLLRRELARCRPDIVQLHLPHPAAAAACLALLPRERPPRLAIWYHADITRQRVGRFLLKPILRACLRRADGIAVSSSALRERSLVLQPFRGRVRAIPFGIDCESLAGATGAGEGPFLFIGRLVYYKGLDLLIEAVGQVPHAELCIVGDGPLRSRLESQVRRAGLQARVRFLGQLAAEALPGLLSGARGLVLPSSRESETFGVVQLEAMAAGLPVVSTRLPTGVSEVNLDGETGRTVPPGDATALAGALVEIVNDFARARAWGEAGRLRVRRLFNRELMAAALEAWYADLLAGDAVVGETGSGMGPQ